MKFEASLSLVLNHGKLAVKTLHRWLEAIQAFRTPDVAVALLPLGMTG